MLTFITVLHVLVIILLVTCVLLQDSKGDGALGMGGGGSSQSLFGATGATNFLVTATRWLAGLFAVTCITLTYYSSNRGQAPSTMDDYQAPAAAAPATSATPDAAAQPKEATAAPAKEASPVKTEKK